MKRILAVAVLVFVADGHEARAEPDCHCRRIQALAASRQMHESETAFDLAILPDGEVRCWGSGCPDFRGAPRNAVAVAAALSDALILHGDGTVEQFVGAGSRMPPVPVMAQSGVAAIAAGYLHSLALREDGTVVAWGAPRVAGRPDPNTMIPADARTRVTAIAAGYLHSLALRDDGRVVQWGILARVPPEVSSDVVAIAGGWAESLAVKRDGRVIEWDIGGNVHETPPGAESDFVAVASGVWHRLALRRDGTVVVWGEGPPFQPTPACSVLRPKGGSVRSIVAGGYHSLALLDDGTVVGWGDPVPYPWPSVPGDERTAPPVDLVGPDCVTAMTGIRVLR